MVNKPGVIKMQGGMEGSPATLRGEVEVEVWEGESSYGSHRHTD